MTGDGPSHGRSSLTGRRIYRHRIPITLLVVAGAFLWDAAFFGADWSLLMRLSADPADGGLGMAWEKATALYRLYSTLAACAPLLGGLLSLLTGPRWLAPIGVVLAGAGFILLGMGPLPMALPAYLALAVGRGLFWPGLVTILGAVFPGSLENQRTATMLFLYAAVNAGLLAGKYTGAMFYAFDHQQLLLCLAGVTALIGAAPLAGASALARETIHSASSRNPRPIRTLGGTAIVMGLMWPHLVLLYGGTVPLTSAIRDGMAVGLSQFVIDTNPLVIVIVASLAALGLILPFERRIPAIAVVGAASVAYALCMIPMGLLGVAGALTLPLAAAGWLGCSVFEPLVGASMGSRIVGDLPPRLGGLVYGVWGGVAGLTSVTVIRWVPEAALAPVVVVFALLSAGAGLVLLVIAGPLDRAFFAEARETKGRS